MPCYGIEKCLLLIHLHRKLTDIWPQYRQSILPVTRKMFPFDDIIRYVYIYSGFRPLVFPYYLISYYIMSADGIDISHRYVYDFNIVQVWTRCLQTPCSSNNRWFTILILYCGINRPVSQWFLYAHLKNGRIMLWQCPSVCPSVRPSVRVFRTFFQHALRYQFQTCYMHLVGDTICWVSSQLGHFDLVYSQM